MDAGIVVRIEPDPPTGTESIPQLFRCRSGASANTGSRSTLFVPGLPLW